MTKEQLYTWFDQVALKIEEPKMDTRQMSDSVMRMMLKAEQKYSGLLEGRCEHQK